MNYFPRVINLKSDWDTREVREFLAQFDLTYEPNEVEYTLCYLKDETIYATGSIKDNILRNIAVSATEQGQGLSSTLISALLQEQGARGRHHNFVYTKPKNADIFKSMGFSEIAKVDGHVSLLEMGNKSIKKYCDNLVSQLPEAVGTRAALVMNCNPFTLGHRAVIEKAAAENDSVVIFVVSEDLSVFPFDLRFELVKKGTAHLDNVTVVEGGKYIISAATFPTYFTKDSEAAIAQTTLDATVFAKHIAPSLSITKRYVGDEPFDIVTAQYNKALSEVLPTFGIEVSVMQRAESDIGVISASAVRAAIKEDRWSDIEKMVPVTTYEALRSDRCAEIVLRIKEG